MPAALLSGSAAAAGIALINSIGNLGGFVGPYLVGLMKDATGSTDGGLVTLAVILALGAVLATRVAHDPRLERPPKQGTSRFRRSEPATAPAQRVS
jgi:nitrate/nitrite transporter NarK